MEDKKLYDDPYCDTCNEDFRRDINQIVNDVENHNEQDYIRKQDELDEAYNAEDRSNFC